MRTGRLLLQWIGTWKKLLTVFHSLWLFNKYFWNKSWWKHKVKCKFIKMKVSLFSFSWSCSHSCSLFPSLSFKHWILHSFVQILINSKYSIYRYLSRMFWCWVQNLLKSIAGRRVSLSFGNRCVHCYYTCSYSSVHVILYVFIFHVLS